MRSKTTTLLEARFPDGDRIGCYEDAEAEVCIAECYYNRSRELRTKSFHSTSAAIEMTAGAIRSKVSALLQSETKAEAIGDLA